MWEWRCSGIIVLTLLERYVRFEGYMLSYPVFLSVIFHCRRNCPGAASIYSRCKPVKTWPGNRNLSRNHKLRNYIMNICCLHDVGSADTGLLLNPLYVLIPKHSFIYCAGTWWISNRNPLFAHAPSSLMCWPLIVICTARERQITQRSVLFSRPSCKPT